MTMNSSTTARTSRRGPAKSGGSIDPRLGQRLRGLRQARHLTQRQLAGGDFTKGYISLIENGATRVSLRAASILADRLGVGVANLLETASRSDRETELRIVQAEALLSSGRAADALAERARAVAEDVTDPRAVANLYENLAATREKQGDLEAALQYARRSLALYQQLGADAEIGSCWNTIGWVFVKRRQFGRAAEALGRAERLAKAQNNGRLMSYVLQNRAELALARGEPEEAARLAHESATSPNASTRCRALSLLIQAQALARGHATDASVVAAFAKAIEALEPHGRGMLGRAYEAQFDALSARGRTK